MPEAPGAAKQLDGKLLSFLGEHRLQQETVEEEYE